MDISVIIPTHDRRDLVERALASVEAQSLAAREIVVVDDGSSDGTAARLRRRFPEARVLTQENRGVSSARNLGIRAATSDWLAFLDSDDEWRPPKLERQVAALERHASFRFCHTDEVWIRRGRRVNPAKKHTKRGGHIFEHCLPLCAISPSSTLLHRSVLERVGLFDESLPACEDYDLWLRISSLYPVLYVDEPLVVKHGGHDDQLSRRHWGMDRFRIRALEKILGEPLGERERHAALSMLLRKIDIYLAGARKRGKLEEANVYDAKRRRYATLASAATESRGEALRT